MNCKGLAETIKDLRGSGYVEDFNLKENCLESQKNGFKAFAEEFRVDRVFRFDEMSDPDDQAVLYAIHSVKTGLRGILLNSFGVYSEASTDKMIAALQLEEHK